ncbi:MAG: TlpA disulfide reductase family protein [Pseudomonadota bacterium]
MPRKSPISFDPEHPPTWSVSHWLNTSTPVRLDDLRGRVVVLVFFQTHCNGSRQHVLPQAERLSKAYNDDQVVVVGLNAPFENKASQQPEAVKTFVRANKLHFAVGIDAIKPSGLPHTMDAYQVQGTPALLIFDRHGRLRRHYLGGVDDIRLSAEIMAFVLEDTDASRGAAMQSEHNLAEALIEPDGHGTIDRQNNDPVMRLPWHLPKMN